MSSSQCVTTANHLGSQADNEWPEVRAARQFSAADVVGDEGSRFGVEPDAPGARTGLGVTLCAYGTTLTRIWSIRTFIVQAWAR
jgi:hypothetical protein